ncbi:helix-turn-helix transcriptional regulator [Fibrella sp. ES10-3-2-2]
MKQRQKMEGAKQSVGTLIREVRKAKGLTQEELAAKMGVQKAMVNGLEQGRSSPTVKTLEKVASALGLTLEIKFS